MFKLHPLVDEEKEALYSSRQNKEEEEPDSAQNSLWENDQI